LGFWGFGEAMCFYGNLNTISFTMFTPMFMG
jgi:hypothetical protein